MAQHYNLWGQVDQDQLGNNVPQNASVINLSVTVSHQKKEQAQKLGSNQIFETLLLLAIQIRRNKSLKWSQLKIATVNNNFMNDFIKHIIYKSLLLYWFCIFPSYN